MSHTTKNTPRYKIDHDTYTPQHSLVENLISEMRLDTTDRHDIHLSACELVDQIRHQSKPGMMEVFLAEYGLSTDEGIALMCLAEALLRVPDAETIDALIQDKIAPSDWGKHLGHSTSPLVNASTWSLMLTGKVLKNHGDGVIGSLHTAIKRLGEPVIRTAVSRAMKEMGRQFVLGETITKAMQRAKNYETNGYTYSYDMLGEAARTDEDATRYHLAYSRAITAIADACHHSDIRDNPGISVKLSALHPRYEIAQTHRVMEELVPRLRSLALLAKSAGMGLNIDAEEADRLSLSMDVIETVLSEPALKGWNGFGVVVQAYGKRAGATIDYLYELSTRLDRKIMVRLVKGAYWDTEIKRAQVEGLADYPVFTSKAATDISYIANAKRLLGMTDRIYPQFATHNAHTVAAILHMADDLQSFEFQRLHGMGENLHDLVLNKHKTRCRIYAPVGAHRDLLAYLVRRLLENGANSSFVNQIVDENVPPATVARDPIEIYSEFHDTLIRGTDIFYPERHNSKGFDIHDKPTLAHIDQARAPYKNHIWNAHPLLAKSQTFAKGHKTYNPAEPAENIGIVTLASQQDVNTAISAAKPWDISAQKRAKILDKAADLYEENFGELFALLAREAGKTLPDCVAELREGVDFLRYYAANASDQKGVGIFTCISPWNFPLAIFSGQIAAALSAGNAVLAKPAEQTPLIAYRLIQLLHKAGVPKSAVQLLPGAGDIGAMLTSDSRIGGVAFTGSTQTAKIIKKSMAKHLKPGAPFIAETGGLNAMIVDSTALPEQAVAAIIESAFQSAGQRCSALRCLYVQKDIAPAFIKMLIGAMKELSLSHPWAINTDIGPVIDKLAYDNITKYVDDARANGRVIAELNTPNGGHFVAPTIIHVQSIQDMEREIFGPILHITEFEANNINQIITDINATGFGLTFGLQSRIDDRVQYVSEHINAGNIYINRNQIGAIVGSQPFGGEGLSGTGPKAGGPLYLDRFRDSSSSQIIPDHSTTNYEQDIQTRINNTPCNTGHQTISMPGPTGESNQLTTYSRSPAICAGPGVEAAQKQAELVNSLGGCAVIAPDTTPKDTKNLTGFSSIIFWGDTEIAREFSLILAERSGPILPLITGKPDKAHVIHERHVCIDTTASGGNAALLDGNS